MRFESSVRENKYHPWAKGMLGMVFSWFSDEYRITSEVKKTKEGFTSRDDEFEHLVVLKNTDRGQESEINKILAKKKVGDAPSYDVIRVKHNILHPEPTVAHEFVTHAHAKQIIEKWNAEVAEQREQKAKDREASIAREERRRRLRRI